MASVNLTCARCTADAACAFCRGITRALRAAGHSITRTSRYDALRAAILGSYGFEACILPVAPHEGSIVDAAGAVLAGTRVALVVEPAAPAPSNLPRSFTVIPAADWQQEPFPTQWIESAAPASNAKASGSPATDGDTQVHVVPSIEPAPFGAARRRLRSLASRARRDLGAVGFGEDARLDAMAALEDEIAWASASTSGFGLVLIIVPLKSQSNPAAAERILSSLRQFIEPAVRESDVIAQGSDSLLAIVSDADEKQAERVAARVKRAVQKAIKFAKNDKLLARAYRRITFGTSVYPAHGLTREALLARATASAKPL